VYSDQPPVTVLFGSTGANPAGAFKEELGVHTFHGVPPVVFRVAEIAREVLIGRIDVIVYFKERSTVEQNEDLSRITWVRSAVIRASSSARRATNSRERASTVRR
jgi:hypothetical protein